MNRRKEHINIFIAVLLVISIILPSLSAAAKEKETVQTQKATVIDVTDYGADPTGVKDSTESVWDALQAAKELEKNGEPVTLNFPKGEYHIYKDKAQIREYHTSNTNSIQSPQKTIGILIDGHENLTVEGNDSLFMMHGNMMAIAVVKSENITLQNFSWDFAVPTVSEMTITGMGTKEGKQYTDFFIPSCFPFAIKGNTIEWQSEPSPYTGDLYWTETGIHNAYSIVAHHPEEEMTRAYFTSDSPFSNVSGITKLSDTQIRITYQSARPSMQKVGMLLELASSAYRETAGAFTWESRNVLVQNVNVHFMHGFGWLLQMTTDVTYRNCNFMPRENSGHYTVSYADIIHASGAAGEINIENCNFSNSHDDPINLHGTFTRVEQRRDNHTLQLKYIHTQQGGFPQYHVGDQVAFFTRDTLESTDHESLYTVSEVVSNPGEDENDLRTMIIKFQEELPSDLSEQIGGQPRFVAENVTYAPQVTVKGCTFKNVPTRGILCTTRNPVLIEDNTFLNMSMASIYLSNDSDEWYESGPIRDMTIRNNTFYIKNIGRTSWEYSPAVYIHPVTKGGGMPSEDNPIHKNILIEGNTFHMDTDTVVKAESVENLTIRNNKILRTSPDIQIQIESVQNQIIVGESKKLNMTSSGDKHERPQDNVYEFTKCKNVLIEGNTYDDGLKLYAVKHPGMSDHNLVIRDKEIKMVEDRNQPAADPVRRIHYASTNPEVISVDDNGNMTGKSNGRSQIFAYYEWNGTIIKSNSLELTAGSGTPSEDVSVTIEEEDNLLLDTENLDSENMSYQFTAATEPEAKITWSVTDLKTGDLSDTASIDENGLLTAKKSGIVWVNAFAGNNTARKAVIIVLPQTETLSKQFSVVREDKDSYTLTPDGVTIDLQPGDLYQITGSNNVKNLFVTARDGKTTDEKVINLKKAVYLSDLTYEPGATVGYGEIQKDKSSSGNALTLADDLGKAVTFHKGIGTHAESVIEYNITGKEYEKLEGYAGVDYAQYNAEYGSVQFQIFVDGEKKFDSGVMLQKTSMKKVDLKIKGASRITLKALAGENNWNDHADWADMKLLSEFQEQAINEFTQTIQRPEHGTITSSVEGTKLTQGSTVTYTFAPEEGYRLKSAAINEALINPENGIYTIESVERDITVTAEFEKIPAPKYTVIFDSNGGSKVENQIVQKHERVTRPADPVLNGYTFGGWYQDSSMTVSWNFEANQIAADTTIYAKWKKDVIPSLVKVNKITLNKKFVNLAVKDSVKISAIVLPANAQNKAVEWTSSNSKVAVVDSTGKVSAKGAGEAIITATAKDGSMVKDQCRVKVGYRITYKLNKGTNAPANPSIYISDQLIKLKKPSRKGYYFSGWYKDRKFKKKITRISKGTKGNQTVYAKWSRVKTEKVNNLELAGKKKGKLKVRFQKVSKASGYQIVYAANKKFKKSKKIDVTRTSKTISKLKKGIYYVKVRAYKKDSKNAKVYGKYSIVKSIRIK